MTIRPLPPDVRARRSHQITVSTGLLELFGEMLRLQADRLHDDFDGGYATRRAIERIADAHLFLVAGRNVWKKLELAANAGSERASLHLGQMRKMRSVVSMRHILERMDESWEKYTPEDTIMDVTTRLGRETPTIDTPAGQVDVEDLASRFAIALDEVREELRTIRAVMAGDVST